LCTLVETFIDTDTCARWKRF